MSKSFSLGMSGRIFQASDAPSGTTPSLLNLLGLGVSGPSPPMLTLTPKKAFNKNEANMGCPKGADPPGASKQKQTLLHIRWPATGGACA